MGSPVKVAIFNPPPLMGGSREGKALSIFLHLYILKSTALGVRGGC